MILVRSHSRHSGGLECKDENSADKKRKKRADADIQVKILSKSTDFLIADD